MTIKRLLKQLRTVCGEDENDPRYNCQIIVGDKHIQEVVMEYSRGKASFARIELRAVQP